MGQDLNGRVLDETVSVKNQRTVSTTLTDIASLCTQQLTFEAKTLLELTSERFEYVRNLLVQGSSSDTNKEMFVKALTKFWTKLYAHSTASLAVRVVGYKHLIQDLEKLHSGADGLNEILRGKEEKWTRKGEFDAAKHEYEAALRRSIDMIIPTWTKNVVMHKTAIDEAARVFQSAIDNKDPMQWADNDLAKSMQPEVSKLAVDAFSHVLNNDNPSWFVGKVNCGKQFAKGSFGTVHYGTLGAQDNTGGAEVVVKKMRLHEGSVVTDDMKNRFIKEVDLWSQLKHPYVLRLFGANHTETPPYMVCEYAKEGDLSNYLQTEPGKKRFWRMLYHVCLGIGYLHEKNIIHGDLKLDNFVLGNDNYARVTDFSLTRVKLSSNRHATVPASGVQAAGALAWRAPECVGDNNVAPQLASDVYSFGMCIYEAFGGIPYLGLADNQAVADQIKEGTLPKRPESIKDDAIWDLITSIARKDPQERPTIHEVSRRLWKFVEVEEEKEEKENKESKDNMKLVCKRCTMDFPPGAKKCASCGSVEATSQIKIDSKADLPRVMELLNSQDEGQRHNAMQALQSYICQDLVQQKEVFDACAISILAKIVINPVEKEDVQREAMSTLACVVIGYDRAQEEMRTEKAVARLVHVVKSGPEPLQCKAANSLGYVSYRNQTIYDLVVGEADLLKLIEKLPTTAATRRDWNRAIKMLKATKEEVAAKGA